MVRKCWSVDDDDDDDGTEAFSCRRRPNEDAVTAAGVTIGFVPVRRPWWRWVDAATCEEGAGPRRLGTTEDRIGNIDWLVN